MGLQRDISTGIWSAYCWPFFLRWPAIQPSAEPPTQVGGAASGWGWSQEGLPSRSQVWLRQTVVSNGLTQHWGREVPIVAWANRGI